LFTFIYFLKELNIYKLKTNPNAFSFLSAILLLLTLSEVEYQTETNKVKCSIGQKVIENYWD